MKNSLRPGLTFSFKFKVPENKTVPHLYPESPEFQAMPKVLATGYMVGLFEWTCIQAINPHIDWPREQTVGIDVKFNHIAATPPGLTAILDGIARPGPGVDFSDIRAFCTIRRPVLPIGSCENVGRSGIT